MAMSACQDLVRLSEDIEPEPVAVFHVPFQPAKAAENTQAQPAAIAGGLTCRHQCPRHASPSYLTVMKAVSSSGLGAPHT